LDSLRNAGHSRESGNPVRPRRSRRSALRPRNGPGHARLAQAPLWTARQKRDRHRAPPCSHHWPSPVSVFHAPASAFAKSGIEAVTARRMLLILKDIPASFLVPNSLACSFGFRVSSFGPSQSGIVKPARHSYFSKIRGFFFATYCKRASYHQWVRFRLTMPMLKNKKHLTSMGSFGFVLACTQSTCVPQMGNGASHHRP